jgi:hypothetical protein
MRVAIRATEEAVIRLLRAGHPLPGNVVNREEETRLPVFQSVEAVPVRNYGIEGNGRIVLARGRKDVWFVDIKRRPAAVGETEGRTFLEMRDRLQERFKGQKVTGWLVTTAKVEKQTQDAIKQAECFATANAAKR